MNVDGDATVLSTEALTLQSTTLTTGLASLTDTTTGAIDSSITQDKPTKVTRSLVTDESRNLSAAGKLKFYQPERTLTVTDAQSWPRSIDSTSTGTVVKPFFLLFREVDPASTAPNTTFALLYNQGEWLPLTGSGTNLASNYDDSWRFAGQISNFYISRDHGNLWTLKHSNMSWSWSTGVQKLACSGTGKFLLGVSSAGSVYRSPDFGTTWTAVSALSSLEATHVCLSGSGQHQYVLIHSSSGADKLARSSDFGASWTTVSLPVNNGSVSADGAYRRLACSKQGKVVWAKGNLRSQDYGASWSAASQSGLSVMDISAGEELVLGESNLSLVRSTDQGQTFSASSLPVTPTSVLDIYVCDAGWSVWVAVETSDGTRYMCRSRDFGATFSLEANWPKSNYTGLFANQALPADLEHARQIWNVRNQSLELSSPLYTTNLDQNFVSAEPETLSGVLVKEPTASTYLALDNFPQPQTFSVEGTYLVTVPEGCTRMIVQAVGGGGGGGGGGAGGMGVDTSYNLTLVLPLNGSSSSSYRGGVRGVSDTYQPTDY